MRKWIIPVVVLFLAPLADAANELGELPRLHHNPFARPDLTKLMAPDGTQTPLRDSAAVLELRATLTGGRTSMANVNGVILSVGDEFEGLRLTDVEEHQAVFEKEGERMVVGLEDED